jgi:hypothetical protein
MLRELEIPHRTTEEILALRPEYLRWVYVKKMINDHAHIESGEAVYDDGWSDYYIAKILNVKASEVEELRRDEGKKIARKIAAMADRSSITG